MAIIRQGTTPTHTFTVPFDTSTLKAVRIVYAQCDKVLFVRTGDDIKMGQNTIITTLTQEETLEIDPKKVVQIQVRVLTNSDDSLASDVMLVSAAKCLEQEVLA